MASSSENTYLTVAVPRHTSNDANIHTLAQKFRDLRLLGFKTAPDAFASQYDIEKERDFDHWIERLIHPKVVQFIALRCPVDGDHAENDIERLVQYEWVGIIALLGPEEDDELSVPSANIDCASRTTASAPSAPYRLFEKSNDANDIHFHLNGTFVVPTARGHKLMDRLMEMALDVARAQATASNKNLRVTLSVYQNNPAAKHVYEKAGFRAIREAPARSRPGFVAIHMQYTA